MENSPLAGWVYLIVAIVVAVGVVVVVGVCDVD